MATTTSKHQAFTMVPNAIIENPNLCLRDKMVLIKLKLHAFYEKRTVYPSQSEIAKSLGIRRETAKAALDSLTGLGVIRPHGKGRKGRQETFTLDLDRAANLTTESACNLTTESAAPDDSVGIKHTAEEDQEKKTPIMTSTSKIEASDSPEAIHTVGNCSAYESPDDSVVRFTKRQINEQLLTPDGKLPDVDGLDCDLNEALILAESPGYFPSSELEKLVAEHGKEYCGFWVSWLLRKIAAEYAADRPVENPAGLFRTAVEQHWEVSPSWPEFDEHKHTDAAWKAKMGIGASTSTEVDDLEDSIPF